MEILTPNEEKCGTRNLQAHRGGATPAAGSNTPCMQVAANDAFFSSPLLWNENTDRSLAKVSHRFAIESAGTPLSNGPGTGASLNHEGLKCTYFFNECSIRRKMYSYLGRLK